jgi:hypothetical protein
MNSLDAGRGAISPTHLHTPGLANLEFIAHIGPVLDGLARHLPLESLLALRACSTQLRASVRPCDLERRSLDELRRLVGRFVHADELQGFSVHPTLEWLVQQDAPVTARLLSIHLRRQELTAAGDVMESTLHHGGPSWRLFESSSDALWLPEGFAGLATQGEVGSLSHVYSARRATPFVLPPGHALMEWKPGTPRCAPTRAAPGHLIVTDGRGRLHLLDLARGTLVDLPGQPDGSVTNTRSCPARSCNGRYVAYLERAPGEAVPGTLVIHDLDDGSRHARELPCDIKRTLVVTDAGAAVVCSGSSVIELAEDSLKVLWEAPPGGALQCISADGRFAFHRFGGDLWIAELRTGRDVRLRGTGPYVGSSALSPLGARLALADLEQRVLVYDLWGADADSAPLIARAVLQCSHRRPQVVFDGNDHVHVLSLVYSQTSGHHHLQTDTLSIHGPTEGPARRKEARHRLSLCALL